jgi:ATP-binding cassette subfamily B protein
MAHHGPGFMMARGFRMDPSITKQKLKPGTVRRIAAYARPYRLHLAMFLAGTSLDALITVVNPLLLREIIDHGILARNGTVVIVAAAAVAAVALADAALGFMNRWLSARIGEGVIYDLRTQVFGHVQRQPIAFFTRAQTGSLVSRLDADVLGAQQAITTTLSSVLSNVIALIAIGITLFYLSWLVSVIALALIPLFLFPARSLGRRMQRLTRESMQLDAEMGSMMNERFNVAGAMLVKLFGRPREEAEMFAGKAAKVRDIGVVTAMYGQVFFVAITLLASLITAVVYGVGGSMVIGGALQLGTLVALSQLLGRVYGPIGSLSNVQVQVMTALVSFDRVFEVLDLEPLIKEKPGAVALPRVADRGGRAAAPDIRFDHVSFRYPTAAEVSLASLESIALKAPERADVAAGVLHDVSFEAPPGRLTALVGPSGAGKTTITQLVSRMYDPNDGAVLIGGHDLRDVTLDSLHEVVGVVTQDAHLFHDTIRANLLYARPSATEEELVEACEAAQIWDLISVLPDGLDTVVGDRGYRLSGGEKQRVALARLLLKAPSIVVLDEATAHLDSESEVAVQRALRAALAGRTSLVIAHRLSTVRDADQILVIEAGQVAERGTHEELLAAGGLYAELYLTQFAGQEHAHARQALPAASQVPQAPQFLARDLLDVGELSQAQRAAPGIGFRPCPAPARAGDRGGDRGADEAGQHGRRRAGAADHVLVAEGFQLVAGKAPAQPGRQPDRPPPAHRALARGGQAGPAEPVRLVLHAVERVRELAVDVRHARPEPGHRHRVAQHGRHRVPAVPDHLHDQRVGERADQGLRAVGEVRAGVAVPLKAPLLDARPDLAAAQAGGRPALHGALQAARRVHLPALGEGVAHHRGGRLAAAAVQRRAAGERVDRLQHAVLPDRDVEARGNLQRPADRLRAGMRSADHEDRPGDLAGVDDEDVARRHDEG